MNDSVGFLSFFCEVLRSCVHLCKSWWGTVGRMRKLEVCLHAWVSLSFVFKTGTTWWIWWSYTPCPCPYSQVSCTRIQEITNWVHGKKYKLQFFSVDSSKLLLSHLASLLVICCFMQTEWTREGCLTGMHWCSLQCTILGTWLAVVHHSLTDFSYIHVHGLQFGLGRAWHSSPVSILLPNMQTKGGWFFFASCSAGLMDISPQTSLWLLQMAIL